MIGTYRDRVVVEKKVKTQTATGRTATWHAVGTVWARIAVLDTRVQVQFMQAGNAHARWRIHFREHPKHLDSDLRYGNVRFRWDDKIGYPQGEIETRRRDASVILQEREDV